MSGSRGRGRGKPREERDGGMGGGELMLEVGRVLRAERSRRGWTQETLAEKGGWARQQVSRLERGEQTTMGMVERAFALMGLRVRVELGPLGSAVDAVIDEVMAGGEEGDLRAWVLAEQLVFWQGFLGRAPAMVMDGPLAARLMGVPIEPSRLDVVVAEREIEPLAVWLANLPSLERWKERWREFRGGETDPRHDGVNLWRFAGLELGVRFVAELPRGVVVRRGDRQATVCPLGQVIADWRDVERVIHRLRERSLD